MADPNASRYGTPHAASITVQIVDPQAYLTDRQVGKTPIRTGLLPFGFSLGLPSAYGVIVKYMYVRGRSES
jgi:hypothetical protein